MLGMNLLRNVEKLLKTKGFVLSLRMREAVLTCTAIYDLTANKIFKKSFQEINYKLKINK
jgi:hypothetical protein